MDDLKQFLVFSGILSSFIMKKYYQCLTNVVFSLYVNLPRDIWVEKVELSWEEY